MKKILLTLLLLLAATAANTRNVNISATVQPAAEVFRSIVEQTGMNFVYSSEILDGMNVTAVEGALQM